MKTEDVGIRAGADSPTRTKVELTTAVKLEERCVHGKVVWSIDGYLWHVKSVTREHPNLVPCDQQLRLPKDRS